jgi:molybdate transport system substrate-binding protein
MQFAMEALTRTFTAKTGITCALTVSASGKLTAQIREGAPYDVFMAADMKYPEEVYKAGLALKAPEAYARGRLVLWSAKAGVAPSLEGLTDEAIRHIALANPRTAPYGVAAEEALKRKGLYEALKHKLVYGESIAQTTQFISTEAAEAGFTAMSVVLSEQMQGQGKWVEIDPALYAPIDQGIVVIRREGVNRAAAEMFYAFMFSAEAKAILKQFGYEVNE